MYLITFIFFRQLLVPAFGFAFPPAYNHPRLRWETQRAGGQNLFLNLFSLFLLYSFIYYFTRRKTIIFF